jgi:osmotically-inducible protein OsmY
MKKTLILVAVSLTMLSIEPASRAPPNNDLPETLYYTQQAKDKQLTDTIVKAIKEDRDTSVYADSITVYTTGGVVTLYGRINSYRGRLNIENRVRRVSGVVKIIDSIEVDTTTTTQ